MLPKRIVVWLEVGLNTAYFAEEILAIAKPQKLHLIDNI
jgi:hypothetical protein